MTYVEFSGGLDSNNTEVPILVYPTVPIGTKQPGPLFGGKTVSLIGFTLDEWGIPIAGHYLVPGRRGESRSATIRDGKYFDDPD